MVNICLYFHVHQPYRMSKYTVFNVGNHSQYFDEHKNVEILRKVANKCYIPANTLMLELINKYKNSEKQFKISYSITGTILEQFEKYAPEVLESFKKLAETGCVDFVGETYYHSLAFLYSKDEFKDQVVMHKNKLKELFNFDPVVFRNTELIYNNDLGKFVKELGFKAVLTEGADHILAWRNPNYVHNVKDSDIKLLLKNYKLSDDIAFRFGNSAWEEYPLTVSKYLDWIKSSDGHSVNLFMDYETFGEHQWADTGIFEFMKHLPEEVLKLEGTNFVTVSELANYESKGELDVEHFISWADIERDLSAWKGNDMQDSALSELYSIEKSIKQTNDTTLLSDWRKLTTSDHFYYMCTKYFNDGDVHKYFNPYDSPYESYINFMNILNDVVIRINKINSKNSVSSMNLSNETTIVSDDKRNFLTNNLNPSKNTSNLLTVNTLIK